MIGKCYKKITMFVFLLLAISFIAPACFADKENKWLWKDSREEKSNCIQAEGTWSYGSYTLNRIELNPDKIINYDMKISCEGRYGIFLWFEPKKTVSVVADENRRNRYVEMVHLADGKVKQRYLSSHTIYFAITLTSLVNPQQVINVKESWVVPANEAAISFFEVEVPKHFKKDEFFRTNIEIQAEPNFYEDYKWLGASIRIPIH